MSSICGVNDQNRIPPLGHHWVLVHGHGHGESGKGVSILDMWLPMKVSFSIRVMLRIASPTTGRGWTIAVWRSVWESAQLCSGPEIDQR